MLSKYVLFLCGDIAAVMYIWHKSSLLSIVSVHMNDELNFC